MDVLTSRISARKTLAGQRGLSAALVALVCWCVAPSALAVPAQYPLLTRSSSQASPNVVFTFDDSGSMAWRFMPDSINISTDNAIRWKTTFHPSDTEDFGNGGSSTTYVIAARPNVRSSNHAACATDTQFTDCAASDLVSARLRSSAYNTLYYNPDIRYQPWYNSDGTQFSNSTASAAWLNPANHSDGTVDLTGNKTFNVNTTWCRSDDDNVPNTTDSTDKAYRAALSSSSGTKLTCATIAPTTYPFDSATCSTAGGTWNSGSTQCRFTSAQGATSGNCSGTFGGTWNSGSSQCRVGTTMTSAFCTNKVGGTWVSPNCRKDSGEELAPAVYYTYSGTTTSDIDNPYKYKRVRIMDLPATGISRGIGRADCATVGSCTRAEEYQNFANWFTYYRTRNYLSIASSSKAFSEQGSDLRIGYGRINKGSASVDGANIATLQRGVRTFAGTDRDSFFTWLHAVPASGGTPLRRAMDDIGKYYQRSTNQGPWGNTPGTDDGAPVTSHLQCRKSYHILMTDGYWNGTETTQATGNVDNTNGGNITGPSGNSYQYIKARPYLDSHSSTLADVAMYYWNRDLRTDLPNRVPVDSKNPAFWQHMVNFTVGLGVNGTLTPSETELNAIQAGTKNWPAPVADTATAIDDLWHAAVNSRGEYLSAKDPDEFASSLSGILEEIQERTATEAGVAAAAATLQVGNRKYVPEYRTAVWAGKLYAYSLGITGEQDALIWEASAAIPAHGSRNILAGTRNGTPKALPFTWAGLTDSLKDDLGAGTTEALVNYLRGSDALEDTVYRSRASKLGDIVNSQPIYVKGLVNQLYNFLPADGAGAEGRGTYRTFVTNKRTRAGLIMVGANDGMLHAFNDSDGSESFAFIPRSVLPNLSALASTSYGHRFYVDGQLTEGDAYIDIGTGSVWKNLVVGSTGAGARGIFAIDVTDYTSMDADNVLWELDSTVDSDIGYVLTPIETGVLRDGSWVAIFGNGSDSGSGTAQLFIVNLSDGSVVKKIVTSSATGNGLGGVRVVRDSNRYIVGAYAGDLKGNIWKFDLSSATADDWDVSFGGSPLYTMNPARPITAAPQFIIHPEGGYMVLAGSGKLYEDGDQTNTDSQMLYGLWDKQTLSKDDEGNVSWTDADPVASTDSIISNSIDASTVSGDGGATYYKITANEMDWSEDRGWKLPLSIVSGHRNLLSPQFIFGLALFETMSPSSSGVVNPCDSSGAGSGYNLLIDPLYGSMPGTSVFDVDGDGDVDADDEKVGGVLGTWDGRDIVLTEPPCTDPETCEDFDRCPDGTKYVSIQGAASGNVNVCIPVPIPSRWWWRTVQEVPE
ncbi:MAG: PilC/PilY family type IV pilus protein [Pseudomonadota bacterium]|nr:PilC/PilY family type IV pilus protein [Pseudomonadota bacterium]